MDYLNPIDYKEGSYAMYDDQKLVRLGKRKEELKEVVIEKKIKRKI